MHSRPLDILRALIADLGPIPCVRVSVARARGRAKQYTYYGATRYVIRIAKAGHVTYTAIERARSDRRSRRLAVEDAAEVVAAEGRLYWDGSPGKVTDGAAERILSKLTCQPPTEENLMESPTLRLCSGFLHGGLAGHIHGCGLYVPGHVIAARLLTARLRRTALSPLSAARLAIAEWCLRCVRNGQ